MSDKEKLTGPERAAVLLMNLGEQLASEVARFMSPQEMQVIGGLIAKKDTVPAEVCRQVLVEFMDDIKKGELSVVGSEFTKSFLTKALGPERANAVLDEITRDSSGGGIESLKWMDPSIIANTVKNEHPQIIALVLAHLAPEKAAQVLLYIPNEKLRGELMVRVATLKRVPQSALKDLELLISKQMLSADNVQGSVVEGVKLAAEILNQVESKAEADIMDVIEKASPDLALKIQEKMFVFSDLMSIDDRGLQNIVKELSSEVLTVALKGADMMIRDKFLRNMSERAAEMLRDDIEAKGPVRLSDVEKAQQEIIKIARRLEQEGKIVRSGRGGDVVV